MNFKKYLAFFLIILSSFIGAGYSMSQKNFEENQVIRNDNNKNLDIKENSEATNKDQNNYITNNLIDKSGFANLTEKLMPSVVSIIASKKIDDKNNLMADRDLRDFLDRFFSMPGEEGNKEQKRSNKEITFGSGFVISPDGYIVTNNHVVENATEITIKFSDDRQMKAKLIGSDSLVDLALLKVVNPKKNLDFVKFGDSDSIKIGNWAIAIGNPFGLGGSVSVGVISAISRDINAGLYDNFIQTDAAINMGHSGGPLFNIEGEVIGINTAIISPSKGNVGIGFAIPSNLAMPILENLKNGEKTKRGYIGVKVQIVTQEMANAFNLPEPQGALVVEIVKDSPAEKAGLKRGDLILELNSKVIKNMRILPRMIASSKINEFIDLKVISGGKEKIVKVKVLENPSVQSESRINNGQKSDKQKFKEQKYTKEFKKFGFSVITLNENIRKDLHLGDDIKGVIINNVAQNSIAEEAGIQDLDIIEEINQVSVESADDFEQQIKDKNSILLQIKRSPTLANLKYSDNQIKEIKDFSTIFIGLESNE